MNLHTVENFENYLWKFYLNTLTVLGFICLFVLYLVLYIFRKVSLGVSHLDFLNFRLLLVHVTLNPGAYFEQWINLTKFLVISSLLRLLFL